MKATGGSNKDSHTYEDSESDGTSSDQYKAAEHSESEEEDSLEADVEVESGEDESKKKSTKAKSKKGSLKPGRKQIIATRKTQATVGTPSITTTIIKSGAHENEGNATRWVVI